jgi:hypothetical protein
VQALPRPDAPVTILRATHPGGSRTNMSPQGGTVVATIR